MITDIREVDITEASLRLRQLESQLQASYSVTTRVLDLKLSDYLR
jgi:flagellin-like hook-associated protein FlgL